jgi:hypothetical protein
VVVVCKKKILDFIAKIKMQVKNLQDVR